MYIYIYIDINLINNFKKIKIIYIEKINIDLRKSILIDIIENKKF